jgi:hypothetical protein
MYGSGAITGHPVPERLSPQTIFETPVHFSRIAPDKKKARTVRALNDRAANPGVIKQGEVMKNWKTSAEQILTTGPVVPDDHRHDRSGGQNLFGTRFPVFHHFPLLDNTGISGTGSCMVVAQLQGRSRCSMTGPLIPVLSSKGK